MNKGCFFYFLTGVFSFTITAQTTSDTLRLFYGINQVQSEINDQKIDSFLTTVNDQTIKLKIFGYADFLHSNKYNESLAQKRADAVKNYIFKKTVPGKVNLLACKSYGEKYSTDSGSREGEAFQRRVDLIIETLKVNESSDNKIDTTKKQIETKKTIESLSKGESLAVEGLNFEPGRHYLVKEAFPVLNNLLKTLKENPNLKIEIQGHICCVEGGEDGMDLDTRQRKLSENRAKAIYDFLVKNGIDPLRLSYKGYGRSKPKVFPERTQEEEQINRRVEIKIIEK